MFDFDPSETLAPQFCEPEGWQWATVTLPGYSLRYGYVSPAGDAMPGKVVVALPGLSEFCEKYFELAHDCLAQGYGFLVLDWRGQGKSSRYLDNPNKRHSQGFDKDAQDLKAVLADSPFSPAAQDFYMMAHSMGGNIGLRFLEDVPGVFKGAAFSAPLVGLHAFAHVPDFLASSLAAGLDRLMPRAYAPLGGDWDPFSRDYQNDIFFSSDKQRAKVHNYWMRKDKALQIGHITNQWLYDAHQSCHHIQHDFSVEALNLPCLFFTAGHEKFVDNAKAHALAARAPMARLTDFPDARHEIWMEKDGIRSEFLQPFYSLVNNNALD